MVFSNVSLALQLKLLKLIRFTDSDSDKNDNVFGISYLSLSWEKTDMFFKLEESIKFISCFLMSSQKELLLF